MIDLLTLTALEAREAMVAGVLGAAEYTAGWREAVVGDEPRAFLWCDCLTPIAVGCSTRPGGVDG